MSDPPGVRKFMAAQAAAVTEQPASSSQPNVDVRAMWLEKTTEEQRANVITDYNAKFWPYRLFTVLCTGFPCFACGVLCGMFCHEGLHCDECAMGPKPTFLNWAVTPLTADGYAMDAAGNLRQNTIRCGCNAMHYKRRYPSIV